MTAADQRLDKDAELMIDALRGFAAFMVFVGHAFELIMAERFGWDPNQTPGFWRFARASLGNGDFWVWCFFVISGLCIHRSIAREIASGAFSWRRYTLARVTRIYPLFLLGLALAMVAWAMNLEYASINGVRSAPWPQLAASFLNMQVFTTPFPNFGPSWSLTCEVLYYAAWPAALLLVSGRAARAAWITLVASLVLVVAIMTLWHVFPRLFKSTSVNGLWTVGVLFPVWIAGAWLGGSWGRISVSRRTWQLALASCLLVMILEWVLRYKHYPHWDRHFAAWGAAPGLVLALAGARYLGLATRSVAEPVCRWLGQFSYPCYILHMPLLVLVNHVLDGLFPVFASRHAALLTVFEMLLVLLVLAFTGPPLERFFMRWRSAVLARYRSPRAVPA